MSGVQRPWLWSLPTGVELAEGAEIRFAEHGESRVGFSGSQIDKMFEVGLMQPPREFERDPDAAVGVHLEGDAQFLVGQVDLGREVDLEVLVRGLEVAVDVSYREYREPHPRVEADDRREDSGITGAAFHEPDLLGLSREVPVPVDEAGDRLGGLLDEVEQGAHVVLVEDGRRVAVMMSWSAYVDLREKLAGMATAFWSAWRSGVFDVAGYATDVTRTLHRHPESEPNPSLQGDEGRTARGGDHDDETS